MRGRLCFRVEMRLTQPLLQDDVFRLAACAPQTLLTRLAGVINCLTDARNVDDQFAEAIAARFGKDGQGGRREQQRIRSPCDQGRYLPTGASRNSARARSERAREGYLH